MVILLAIFLTKIDPFNDVMAVIVKPNVIDSTVSIEEIEFSLIFIESIMQTMNDRVKTIATTNLCLLYITDPI